MWGLGFPNVILTRCLQTNTSVDWFLIDSSGAVRLQSLLVSARVEPSSALLPPLASLGMSRAWLMKWSLLWYGAGKGSALTHGAVVGRKHTQTPRWRRSHHPSFARVPATLRQLP